MSTRGFSSQQKEQIAAKIRAMDELLDQAREAYLDDRILAANVALERLQEMKLGEFITLFPPIELSEPRKDVPFSVLYEAFSRILRGFFEFLAWAQEQARKPPQERDLSGRERWLNEYRGILDDLRYLVGLAWSPGDLARPWLDLILGELERLLKLLETFAGAQPPSSSEIETIWTQIVSFLRAASDDDFSLHSLFGKLFSMDDHITHLPRKFLNRNDPLTRDLIDTSFEAIASWKHAIGQATAAAATH